MTPRIDLPATSAFKAMLALQAQVNRSGIEQSLLDLVNVRTSQINGCAYCIDMHTKDARATGENEQRLFALDAWRETPFFSARERAALAWTEAVTAIGANHVPDPLYAKARETFSEAELVALTLAVVSINGWNRLCIAFRSVAGVYQSTRRPARRIEASEGVTAGATAGVAA